MYAFHSITVTLHYFFKFNSTCTKVPKLFRYNIVYYSDTIAEL